MVSNPVVQLSLDSIHKSFASKSGPVPVLNGLTFDVMEQDFLSIIGPSGCGKSTIFNIIAGKGTDPRGGRPFNVAKQTKDHDPDGAYQRMWLNEAA